jgi:hypothetical protein
MVPNPTVVFEVANFLSGPPVAATGRISPNNFCRAVLNWSGFEAFWVLSNR